MVFLSTPLSFINWFFQIKTPVKRLIEEICHSKNEMYMSDDCTNFSEFLKIIVQSYCPLIENNIMRLCIFV